ncbi:D-lactonohydrolase-like protein [Infundibulicybe gibba]|nr:D-lactonohydrolase-like protein [Infundibulicybe gibba]
MVDIKAKADNRGPQKRTLAGEIMLLSLSICVIAALLTRGQGTQSASSAIPPQSVFIDPRSFAVLGPNETFRSSSFNELFNPTSTAPPFFQIFDKGFLSILGDSPSIHEVASNPNFAFAHEAPIYNMPTDEVFFASNDGGPLGESDLNHNNLVGKISLTEIEAALARNNSAGATVRARVTELDLPDTIQMINGGTGPYHGSLLLITSGRGARPPSIALVNPKAPHNATVLLDNYFGRQFNSLNDIKVHPSGKLFFTDVVCVRVTSGLRLMMHRHLTHPRYGFLNHFRPNPLLPNQVYRLDPDTGAVRVVATDFDKCNGIAFTADGQTAYIADTGALGGFLGGFFGNNQTEPATIYTFDVDPRTHVFKNRRVFTYVDTGAPDGIQVDLNGNMYAGCGDGVQVWNDEGTLVHFANMVFAGDGRLVIMADTKIFLAHIAAKEIPPISP